MNGDWTYPAAALLLATLLPLVSAAAFPRYSRRLLWIGLAGAFVFVFASSSVAARNEDAEGTYVDYAVLAAAFLYGCWCLGVAGGRGLRWLFERLI
jgi:hypothetical protein